jgi:hypothetical protein
MSTEPRSPLEKELRALLRREEPSADFSQRVMSRLGAAGARRTRQKWFPPFPRVILQWVAGGALACLLAAIGVMKYQQHRRTKAEGDLAREQAMVALRIASAKLNVALKQVHELEDRRPPRRGKARSQGRMEHL